MKATILVGDVLARLAELADASVRCVVTSPPYWGLRDYGTATWEGGEAGCRHSSANGAVVGNNMNLRGANETEMNVGGWDKAERDGNQRRTVPTGGSCDKCGARRIDAQIGLEPTPEAYVAKMVEVFREVWRVLADDGTLWLNLGDSYATGAGSVGSCPGGGAQGRAWSERGATTQPNRMPIRGLKPKDLVGIPWRVAFALQADGWYLRSDIIWSKPNPMPESVTDRPTKSHEYVFLLSKQPRYFFDQEAVRLPVSENWERGGGAPMPELGAHRPTDGARGHQAQRIYDIAKGPNIRSVWEIATQPFPEAHFATFPETLAERCIKAGTSEKGCCSECGKAWERVTGHDCVKCGELIPTQGKDCPACGFRNTEWREQRKSNDAIRAGENDTVGPLVARRTDITRKSKSVGWTPGCEHGGEPVACTVLDPFCGSGTTGVAALNLRRNFVGIELNPKYAEMAERRIGNVSPLLDLVSQA